MQRFNLFHGELEPRDEAGFRSRTTRVATHIGADKLGGMLIELDAGDRFCPYHFHSANEEWLLVVDGEPALRTPEGTRQLRRGDVVCFPTGPSGAHDVTGPGRVLIVSTMHVPEIPVYPDSDKVGTRPSHDRDDPYRLNFLRRDAVGYYEGEV